MSTLRKRYDMAKSPYKPYTPKPEQMALVPKTSGNTINGLGETEFRKPQHVYWSEPDDIAHGELQKFFFEQNPDNPAIVEARAARDKLTAPDVPPVTTTPLQQSAKEWSEQLAQYTQTIELELFGITAFNPDWAFEGVELDYKWVIMLGVAHDYEKIKTAPEVIAGAEVIRQYGRAKKASKDVTTWIRNRGWDAFANTGPMAGTMVMIPPAIECGFGELGKHGSIINNKYGSSFRLSCVLTNVPLISTPRQSYGVDDFCSRCQVCDNACPPEAISPEKVSVRGQEKWYVDFDKCIPFFNENYGCSICISVCPWSIPGRGPRIVEQLLRRQEKSKN
ncbi:MAG: epoxyqueuosine reductase [Halioglobus sp.]|jgi:epoxyqueuosine reductase